MIKDLRFELDGFRPVEEAIVTSGGVKVSGIDPRTMKPVFVERDPMRKRQQKEQFFRKK